MSNVHPISAHLNTLDAPKFLRDLPGWLMWRFESNPSKPDAKPLKVPYYVNGVRRHGAQGSDEDRKQLVTFEVARRVATRRGFSGVGLCILPEFGVLAGDFDACVDGPFEQDAGVHPSVLDLVYGTYAEYSPSGTGVRAFWRGEPRGNGKDPHGKPFGLEIFSTKGFVTFTGHALWQTEFNGCEDHVEWLGPNMEAYITERLGTDACRASTPTGEASDVLLEYAPKRRVSMQDVTQALQHLDPNMPRDPWLKVGMALHHEFDGSPDAFVLWDTWSSTGASYGEGVTIERVWESFGNNTGRTPITWGTVQKMVNDVLLRKIENEPVKGTVQNEADYAPRFMHVNEYLGRGFDMKVLIKDLLPKATLSVIFGASTSGKTFITLDIALAIARGVYWRDGTKRTEQTGVAYVVAEGTGGMQLRVQAYLDHFVGTLQFPQDVPFALLEHAPDLMEVAPALDLAEKVNALPHKVGLVVVDTLAQTMRGDENSAKEMGCYVANCRAIHRRTGAMVLLVHHSGKDAARGMRGSSTLFAAADVVLEVLRQPEGRVIRASKMKDGRDDQVNYHFNLKPVVLFVNEHNEAVDSCVVEHIEPQAPAALSDMQKSVLEGIVALAELQDEFGKNTLVNEVFRARNDRQIARTGEPLEESSAKKRIRKAVDEYAELPSSGIEVVGDRITVTDPENFNL